jgi:hypothetical protein
LTLPPPGWRVGLPGEVAGKFPPKFPPIFPAPLGEKAASPREGILPGSDPGVVASEWAVASPAVAAAAVGSVDSGMTRLRVWVGWASWGLQPMSFILPRTSMPGVGVTRGWGGGGEALTGVQIMDGTRIMHGRLQANKQGLEQARAPLQTPTSNRQ